MAVWRYAWTIAPLLATVALGTNIVMQGGVWIGGFVVTVGVLGLLLVILKEVVERPERRRAYYRIDGPQAAYLYSYTEFRRLPEAVRGRLLQVEDVSGWYRAEMRRHGGDILDAHHTLASRLRYRLSTWALNLLT